MLVHAAGHAEREGAKKANSRRRKKREVGGEKRESHIRCRVSHRNCDMNGVEKEQSRD